MQVLRRFKTDQSGATAMIFGLSLIPLMGTVGAAVDYSRAASFHSHAQLAVDAAALALVREPSTMTGAEVQAKGEQFVRNTLDRSIMDARRGNALSSVTATRVGNTVKVSMAGTSRPAILQAIGYRPIPVSASSQATWGPINGDGYGKIELALVLDNTGSMADNIGGRRKMDELKSAAGNLLKDLRGLATEQDSVKVSIVPFDTEVRLDANQTRYKPWFRWENESKDRPVWTGYVYDRHNSFATSDAAPAGGDSLYPAPRDTEYRTNADLRKLSSADLSPIRALTSLSNYADYSSLTGVIGGMQPRGYTNIALGVTWGMATLSQSEPFTEAAPAGSKGVKKYMVVLTDGKNTMNHVNGDIFNSEWEKARNRAKADQMVEAFDAKTLAACSTVKNTGVEVFTIRLLEGNADMLRSCASSGDKYFDVQNAGELAKAFQTILLTISGTRLTH